MKFETRFKWNFKSSLKMMYTNATTIFWI
jgi:hypothetical protein